MIQAVLLFLVAMAVIGVWGRMKRAREAHARCPNCGRHKIGKGPCACGRKG